MTLDQRDEGLELLDRHGGVLVVARHESATSGRVGQDQRLRAVGVRRGEHHGHDPSLGLTQHGGLV
jgi:hypothetical protein